jgi:hypothetical protein
MISSDFVGCKFELLFARWLAVISTGCEYNERTGWETIFFWKVIGKLEPLDTAPARGLQAASRYERTGTK